MAADGIGAVVVDTNVIFSALLRRESRFAETLLRGEHRFHVCESVLVELFKHKEKILRLSRLADEALCGSTTCCCRTSPSSKRT